MRATTNSYGIVPYDAFDWMLRKGDLVASNRDGCVSSKYFWVPSHSVEKRKLNLKIYRCSSDDDDHPESLSSGKHGTYPTCRRGGCTSTCQTGTANASCWPSSADFADEQMWKKRLLRPAIFLDPSLVYRRSRPLGR